MTKWFVFLLAIASMAAAPTAVAQERLAGMRGARHVLPAYEIMTILRSTGFEPVGRPVRRGRRYEVDAIDPYDADVRLIVNARTGRIVAVRHADGPGLDGPDFYGPDLPPEDLAQNDSRWRRPSWSVNRSREPRMVPPGSIPSSRSAALGPETTPLPRPRPSGQAVAASGGSDVEVTGSIGPTMPKSSRDLIGPVDPAASTAQKKAPIDMVPVVPLF